MSSRITLPLALLALVAACGSEKPEVKEPVAPPPPPAVVAPAPAVPEVDNEANAPSVHISPEIQTACGISEADAHFAFNRAEVRSQDASTLKKLATCFSAGGALAGRSMRLVGHTDPRGDEEYNFVLGERRADSVMQYLIREGLSPSQMTASSRGELDATGTTEAAWAADRRVDILLVK